MTGPPQPGDDSVVASSVSPNETSGTNRESTITDSSSSSTTTTTTVTTTRMSSSRERTQTNTELSLYITVAIVFVTHGITNALLLSPLNPLRGAFYTTTANSFDSIDTVRNESADGTENSGTTTSNVSSLPFSWSSSSTEIEWSLNWLSLSHLHMFVLLSCLIPAAMHNKVLERRLICVCMAIILVSFSNGLFTWDYTNTSITTVQLIFYMGLITVVAHYEVVCSHVITISPFDIRSSSYDYRRPLSLTTVAVLLQFLLSAGQVVERAYFANGYADNPNNNNSNNNSSTVCQLLSARYYTGECSGNPLFPVLWKSTTASILLVTVLLGYTAVLATRAQQSTVLQGHAAVLFLQQVILATWSSHQVIDPAHLQSTSIVTFLSIASSLIGAFTGNVAEKR